MILKYAAVGLAGAAGAVLRYAFSLWGPVSAGIFPTGTLIVNLTGAFLLTFTGYYLFKRFNVSDTLKTAVSVGFLGSFTTFSALSLEVLELINRHHYISAFIYVFLSITGGVIMSYSGYRWHKFPGVSK